MSGGLKVAKPQKAPWQGLDHFVTKPQHQDVVCPTCKTAAIQKQSFKQAGRTYWSCPREECKKPGSIYEKFLTWDDEKAKFFAKELSDWHVIKPAPAPTPRVTQEWDRSKKRSASPTPPQQLDIPELKRIKSDLTQMAAKMKGLSDYVDKLLEDNQSSPDLIENLIQNCD